ncbi:MAG: thioether cross-link-forming SCIFF peptide maturase [Clostridiales Family XIII bacterium]|nr:thioether cross-link-forming SCIFF peptide maturase [Clostridiales Family XIII bacterium]
MIHLYRFHELNIVLDVGSGAVHILSDEAADVLRAAGGGGDFSAGDGMVDVGDSEAAAELEALRRDGTLFAPEPDKAAFSPERRGAVIKAMCLHVAHDCNMRCAYCFADTGGFHGARALLPLETGKRAVDFLLEASGGRRNLELDFFGGEPLMNWDVVKALVLYGRERERGCGKHLRFTITTNGLLLDDEKTAFINEHMDNVILSIDGRPEVNDRMRRTVSGAGTYALVIDRLLRFKEARERAGKLYYVRGTYTKWNRDFSEDVKHLAGLGFRNISVEPAVTDEADPAKPWALTTADLDALYAEYDRLADLMLAAQAAGAPLSFFHFNIDLAQGPCVYKRSSGCGAGTEYVAVTPEGDIYPCHQFAGEKDFLLGNVGDAAPLSAPDIREHFARAHIYSKPDCSGCWAKYYCSGGCHANALHFEGDLLKPHRLSCALEKKRIECAIGIMAASS